MNLTESADLPELRAHIRARRPALAGFMDQGADLVLDGDLLRVSPRNDIYIRYLNDNRASIGELASELYGRNIRVMIEPEKINQEVAQKPEAKQADTEAEAGNTQKSLSTSVDPAEFVARIVEPGRDGWLEVRAIKNRKVILQSHCRNRRKFKTEIRGAAEQGADIYFGVAARANDKSGKLDDCQHLAALFTDIDFKMTPESAAFELLERFALKPSAIVPTGGGLHVYWILSVAIPLPGEAARATAILRKLTVAVGGDLGAAEPARVLRVPGTQNHKYDPPRTVELRHFDPAIRYSLEEIEAAVAGIEDPRAKSTHGAASSNGASFKTFTASQSHEPVSIEQAEEMLKYVDSDDRETWLRAAMSLKNEFGQSGRPLWDVYSQRSAKYDPADQEKTWNSIDVDGGITIATLIKEAKDRGRAPKSRAQVNHNGQGDGADGQQEAEPEWSEPISLDVPMLPRVPTDTFPPAIGDMIDETAAATETPRELAFGMALGTLAAACQRKIEVRVKPGYIEPLSLWPITPLNSGERKTAVLQRMTLPLTKWEREQASRMKAEIAKALSERETALAQIQAMRTKAARLEPGSADFAEASKKIADLEVNLKEVPRAPRVWAQDVTPEKLGVLMADHGEQLTIISDEGGIIEIMAGRYSRGIPNLDIFLQGHAGAPHRVDRGNRPPVLMQHPALTMALSPQPEVLHGLAANRDFRGRGLLARFVYLLGTSTLGYRTGEPPCAAAPASMAYEACVQRLLAIKPPPEGGALTIELSDDARTEWRAYFVEVEKDLRPDGRFEYMRDWAGKLPGMAARVAGLLHCAEHAFDDDLTASKLSLNTMKRALDFAAVCERHALAAYDLMGADLALEAARRLWGWVERQRKVEFTFRSAFKALQGSYPRAADLEPAFAVLLERAYIANKQTAPRIGRPTRVYQVNPALTERWAKEGKQWTGERRAI